MSREMAASYSVNRTYRSTAASRAARMRRLRRRKQALRRKMLLAATLLVMAVSLVTLSGFTSAHQEQPLHCYYTTHEVFSGDTLMGIASQYSQYANKSMNKYMKEIMKLNNMGTSRIYAGQVLVIPYYSDIEK